MCTTPCQEKCAQLGDENYERHARLEAAAFIDQLERTYGEAPSGSYFAVVDCPHDFGVYLDVKFAFDEGAYDHAAYLDRIQESVDHWDAIAKARLESAGYMLIAPPLKISHRAA